MATSRWEGATTYATSEPRFGGHGEAERPPMGTEAENLVGPWSPWNESEPQCRQAQFATSSIRFFELYRRSLEGLGESTVFPKNRWRTPAGKNRKARRTRGPTRPSLRPVGVDGDSFVWMATRSPVPSTLAGSPRLRPLVPPRPRYLFAPPPPPVPPPVPLPPPPPLCSLWPAPAGLPAGAAGIAGLAAVALGAAGGIRTPSRT